MIEIYERGDADVRPDVRTFTAAIDAISQQRECGGYFISEELFSKRFSHDPDCALILASS